MYHESELAKSYPPDILLAFNAGIWGYDDWLPTLRYILKSDTSNLNRVPLVITSYNRLEAEDDEDVLLKLLKSSGTGEEADKLAVDKHCVWGVEKNQHPDESSRRKEHDYGTNAVMYDMDQLATNPPKVLVYLPGTGSKVQGAIKFLNLL